MKKTINHPYDEFKAKINCSIDCGTCRPKIFTTNLMYILLTFFPIIQMAIGNQLTSDDCPYSVNPRHTMIIGGIFCFLSFLIIGLAFCVV